VIRRNGKHADSRLRPSPRNLGLTATEWPRRHVRRVSSLYSFRWEAKHGKTPNPPRTMPALARLPDPVRSYRNFSPSNSTIGEWLDFAPRRRSVRAICHPRQSTPIPPQTCSATPAPHDRDGRTGMNVAQRPTCGQNRTSKRANSEWRSPTVLGRRNRCRYLVDDAAAFCSAKIRPAAFTETSVMDPPALRQGPKSTLPPRKSIGKRSELATPTLHPTPNSSPNPTRTPTQRPTRKPKRGRINSDLPEL